MEFSSTAPTSGPSVLSGIDLLMNPRKKNSSAGSDAGSVCSSISERISRGSSTKVDVPDHQIPVHSIPSTAMKWPPPKPVNRTVPPLMVDDDGGCTDNSGEVDDDDCDNDDDDDGSSSAGGSGSSSSVVAAAATRFMHMSPEEILRKKREILYELARIERKGVNLPRRYTMDDPLEDMRTELDRLRLDRELDISVRFQRKMLMTCITGIELLNGKFDPFSVKLDGWSDSVHENMGDYDEVFEDLHMKYRGKAKMAPEIKLMMMVAGSGVMFHLTNSMFRASAATVPGFDEVMRQNPHLMRQYTEAAMNTKGGGGGGGGGGGLFGNLGSLFGGIFGGGASPPGASVQPQHYPSSQIPQQQQQQQPMMRGPKPVNEVLHELHRNAFGGGGSPPMPPMPVNTRPYMDSDRIEIISNASDADTHISELADIVTPAVVAATPVPKKVAKAPRAPAAGKRKTATAA